MLDLSKYLSSKARYKILEVLSQQRTALPLRHIAEITDLPVHSVELALKGLVRQRIVRSKREKRFKCFELKSDQPDTVVLRDLFAFLQVKRMERRAQEYNQRAQASLRFVQDAETLWQNVRLKK